MLSISKIIKHKRILNQFCLN